MNFPAAHGGDDHLEVIPRHLMRTVVVFQTNCERKVAAGTINGDL
jgi:hypothetical protein